MKFSDNELATIAKAKQKIKYASIIRVAIIFSILFGMALLFFGIALPNQIIYWLFSAVVLAIAIPQFGYGPKYEELLKMLEDKANEQQSKT